MEEIRIDTWHRGPVVLVGDAAHATGPVWAQGAAAALEDAQVLAEMLGSRSDWTAAVSAWELRRRPRVDHVQAATDRMSHLARLPGCLSHNLAPIAGPAPTGRLRSAARPALNQIAIGPLVSGALCRRTAARLPAGIRRR